MVSSSLPLHRQLIQKCIAGGGGSAGGCGKDSGKKQSPELVLYAPEEMVTYVDIHPSSRLVRMCKYSGIGREATPDPELLDKISLSYTLVYTQAVQCTR